MTHDALSDLVRAGCKSALSAEANLARVRMAARRLGCEPAGLYADPAAVVAWVEGGRLPDGRADRRWAMKSEASQKNVYSSLLKVASCVGGVLLDVPDEARRLFSERMTALAAGFEKARLENALTEREAVAMLPWTALREAYASRRGALASASDRLLLDLYLMCPDENPPKRLDYGALQLVPEGGEAPETGNCLFSCLPDGCTLLLRDYKTAASYGAFEQRLPDALAAEVLAFVRAAGPDRRYLFEAEGGGPVSDNTLGRRLSTAVRRLSGVPMGASNLRKAYVSHLLNTRDISQARLHETARLMMHSPVVQQDYRRVIGGDGS